MAKAVEKGGGGSKSQAAKKGWQTRKSKGGAYGADHNAGYITSKERAKRKGAALIGNNDIYGLARGKTAGVKRAVTTPAAEYTLRMRDMRTGKDVDVPQKSPGVRMGAGTHSRASQMIPGYGLGTKPAGPPRKGFKGGTKVQSPKRTKRSK